MKGRPENLQVIGPLRWEAALYEGPGPYPGKGRPPKKGERLPTPLAMIEDTAAYPRRARRSRFPKLERRAAGPGGPRRPVVHRRERDDPVMVVLVRDPLGQWRDEALVATDPTVSAAFVILGYCRRWSVELAFFDSKQYLGLHDPRVWSERSVERAHPMAWFVGTLTILWYAVSGHAGAQVERDRPWYPQKVTPTFSDMLGALRLQMWQHRVYGASGTEVGGRDCSLRVAPSKWLGFAILLACNTVRPSRDAGRGARLSSGHSDHPGDSHDQRWAVERTGRPSMKPITRSRS